MNRHRIITHLPDANMIVGAAIAFTAPDVNNSIHRPHEGVQCGDLEYSRAMDFKDGANETVEYTWDANGNMTSDLNKGITSITYNVLNLPERIMYDDNHLVFYTYAADGRKLQVKYLLNTLQTIVQPGINPGLHGGNGETGLMSVLPPITPRPRPDSLEINPSKLIVTLSTVDYCAGHVYRNGVLERTMNDYGYQSDSTYYYFIKDYQGHVRAVMNQNGTLKEINNYYPYGGLMGAASAGVQPNKYGAKELDRENGLDWYDSQARMLDPMIGRTTTMDPLCEKYYSISPYAWCAGNPIFFIDKGGTKIEFANNSSNEFKTDYQIAYDYLKSNNASYVIDELDRRDNVFYLEEYDGDSYFNSNNNTIFWNPKRALITYTVYILSPAEILSHEADHAVEYDKNPDETKKRNRQVDSQYGNLEEKRVIEGSEQEVAKRLGKLKHDGGKTRDDHNGTGYTVNSPDSEDIEGITVVPSAP